MKTIITATLAFITTLVISGRAHADILIDPYISIIASGNYDSGASSNKIKSGNIIGARLGYSFLGFAIGADYGTGTQSIDTSPSSDGKYSDLGLFASFTFPVLVRAYATYSPNTTLTVDSGSGSSKLLGTANKIGVGFTGLPFITLNLEMWSASYSKVDTALGTFDVSSKATATMLSVSMPFEF